MSSIDTFKSSVMNHGGLARTNRFNIIFTPPKFSLINKNPTNLLGNLASGSLSLRNLVNDPRDISLLCESTTLPGRQISTLEAVAHQETHKIPYAYTDLDVTCNFLITQDYYIKTIFDNWSEGIFDTENYTVGYKKDFVTDVRIQQINTKNIPVYGIVLRNAFPTGMADISLDNTAENSIQKFSVTFAYDKWEQENALESTIGALRSLKKLI